MKHDVNRILLDRARYGSGYHNASLEAKRRQAIDWMRINNQLKWQVDRAHLFARSTHPWML